MTGPNASNAVITCVLAGQLDDTHYGKPVAFYADGRRVHGVLEHIDPWIHGERDLTVSGHRYEGIGPSDEIDVITKGPTL